MNQGRSGIQNHLSVSTLKWFAISTRYKSEKDVARRLVRKGIECYVPINTIVRQYASKRKVVELPLINCYAFVRICRSDYVKVLETEHVLKFIHFSGNLISIPDDEIQLLQRICQEVQDIETESIAFEKYRKVEIIAGNLTGIKGRLIDFRGRNFLVELDHIGISLRMEIDGKLLRPIGLQNEVEGMEGPALGQKYWS